MIQPRLNHPELRAAFRRLAAYIAANLQQDPRPVPSLPADPSPSLFQADRGPHQPRSALSCEGQV